MSVGIGARHRVHHNTISIGGVNVWLNNLTLKCIMIMMMMMMMILTITTTGVSAVHARDTKQQLVGGVATSGGPQALLEPATDGNVEEEMEAEMAAAAAWAESPANTQPTAAVIEGALNVVQTNNVVAARLRQRIQRTRQASKLVSAAAAKRAAASASSSSTTTQSQQSVSGNGNVSVAPSMVHLPKAAVSTKSSTNLKTILKSANTKAAVKTAKAAATAGVVASKRAAIRMASTKEETSVKVKGVAGVDLNNIDTTNQQQSSQTVANNLPMTAQLIDGLFDSAIH